MNRNSRSTIPQLLCSLYTNVAQFVLKSKKPEYQPAQHFPLTGGLNIHQNLFLLCSHSSLGDLCPISVRTRNSKQTGKETFVTYYFAILHILVNIHTKKGQTEFHTLQWLCRTWCWGHPAFTCQTCKFKMHAVVTQ